MAKNPYPVQRARELRGIRYKAIQWGGESDEMDVVRDSRSKRVHDMVGDSMGG